MSGRRRHVLSPSLFPFLAVLVCTLGTLILFLALVAQNATEAAEQNSRAERRAKLRESQRAAEAQTPRLTAKAVHSMLDEEQFRIEQLVAFRDQQTTDLGQRRDRLTHLQQHTQRLREKLKQLSDEVDHAMGETEIKQIKEEEIADLSRRIDAKRAEIDQLRRLSQNKTPRVVIVPHKGPNGTDRRPVYLECTAHGVTIWPEGAQISMTQLQDSNYSANPLDAALRVIRLHTMQNYGDTTPPYPLLIVRPDGIDAYAAARGAMQDWDDQFGYELVPSNVQLAYSKPDPNLKQRVDVAIRNAAAKQHAQHAIARRAGRNGGQARGGDLHGNARRGRLPTLSAAALDRAGRSSGFRSHRDLTQYGSSRSRSDVPYTTDVRNSDKARYSSGADYGAAAQGGATYADPTGDAGSDARQWAQEMADAALPMRESHGSGEASDAEGDHDDTLARQQNATTADDKPGGAESSATMTDAHSGDSSTAKNSPSSQNTAGQQASSSGPPPSMTMPPSGSDAESASSGTPQVSMNQTPSSELVKRQGRDWALPPEMSGIGGNAIVRNIRLECHPDRFVLLPPNGGGATEIFGFLSGDVERATLRLATAIRDRIERWGPALPGGKWQPRLDVLVMPRGEMRFHQLRTLMSGSGVEVAGRARE